MSFFFSQPFNKGKLLALSLSTLLVACCPSPEPDQKPAPLAKDIDLKPTRELYAATSEAFQTLDSRLPTFACIQDVKEKKHLFFGYMLQMVRAHNQDIREYRDSLFQLKHLNRQLIQQVDSATLNQAVPLLKLSNEQQDWLKVLAKKHQVHLPKASVFQTIEEHAKHSDQWFDELLKHIDIIPASMALAQSANESAWGTSRFAVQANNLFGQWCFSKGCGLVPEQRPDGATYEVQKFSNPAKAVGQYMYNINRNDSYIKVRRLRADARYAQQPISGIELAEGLEKYSARGHAYIEELQSMIRYNQLMRWDTPEAPYPAIDIQGIPSC